MAQEGIITGHNSRIERVRLFGNGGDGVRCGDGCEVLHCVVNNNQGNGITISDFSANGRGVVSSNVVQYNAAAGIQMANGGGLVTGNSVNNNGFGLICGNSQTGYSNNVFAANGAFPIGCVNMGQNVCSGAACP